MALIPDKHIKTSLTTICQRSLVMKATYYLVPPPNCSNAVEVHLSNQHGKTNLERRGFSDEECCDKKYLVTDDYRVKDGEG